MMLKIRGAKVLLGSPPFPVPTEILEVLLKASNPLEDAHFGCGSKRRSAQVHRGGTRSISRRLRRWDVVGSGPERGYNKLIRFVSEVWLDSDDDCSLPAKARDLKTIITVIALREVNGNRPCLAAHIEFHRNDPRAAIYVGKIDRRLLAIAVLFGELRGVKHVVAWVIKGHLKTSASSLPLRKGNIRSVRFVALT
jgi:hypothetical protein